MFKLLFSNLESLLTSTLNKRNRHASYIRNDDERRKKTIRENRKEKHHRNQALILSFLRSNVYLTMQKYFFQKEQKNKL